MYEGGRFWYRRGFEHGSTSTERQTIAQRSKSRLHRRHRSARLVTPSLDCPWARRRAGAYLWPPARAANSLTLAQDPLPGLSGSRSDPSSPQLPVGPGRSTRAMLPRTTRQRRWIYYPSIRLHRGAFRGKCPCRLRCRAVVYLYVRLRILASQIQSAGFGSDRRSPLVAARGRASVVSPK